MPPPISKEAAQAYRSRWKLVSEIERRELRETPPQDKFQQLAALMSCTKGWPRNGHGDEEEVRIQSRWNRLRKSLGA